MSPYCSLGHTRLGLAQPSTIDVTSFSVFHTKATVSIGRKKLTQNGNIHSVKLDVYAVKQRASNLSFIYKLGRKYYTLASSPLTTHKNLYDTRSLRILDQN